MEILKNIWQFLQGKKTFISAGFLALVALGGFFQGSLSETSMLLILGAAASLVGLGDKFNQHRADITQVLEELKAGNKSSSPVLTTKPEASSK